MSKSKVEKVNRHTTHYLCRTAVASKIVECCECAKHGCSDMINFALEKGRKK